MPTINAKLNECLEATVRMLEPYFPSIIPGKKMLANDNGKAKDWNPLALPQEALAQVTPAEAAQLNEARHCYITDMVRDLFLFIRAMPEDMAIAELEAVARETDQTIKFFKEKDHGQSSQKTH